MEINLDVAGRGISGDVIHVFESQRITFVIDFGILGGNRVDGDFVKITLKFDFTQFKMV